MPTQQDFLFSVVIPTHNRPDFLKRALNGLEQQNLSLEKFEVVIILSPNDLSIAWLNNYSGPLNLYFEAPTEDIYQGKNVSFKRNYGAKNAKAPWLAFTDDDCFPTPTWLSAALEFCNDSNNGGIEGKTITPKNSPRTVTWKGMQRLARPKGFQTCNIFFGREDFMSVGGFDFINFPWFLEDTDMAWSILDLPKDIPFAEQAIVEHPVGPEAPWRLTHEAKNTGLKVRLLKKHPEIFKSHGMKTLRLSQYLYFGLGIGILLNLLAGCFSTALVLSCFSIGLLSLHMFKLFRGMQTSASEVLQVAHRTFTYPFYALWSLTKEAIFNRLSPLDFLKILLP